MVTVYTPVYVGATGDNPRTRLLSHARRFGDIDAYVARSGNMKSDEQSLINKVIGRKGNQNKMPTSGVQSVPGYTYAIYDAGAAPGA